jgi:hypothetical protein
MGKKRGEERKKKRRRRKNAVDGLDHNREEKCTLLGGNVCISDFR